MSSQPDDRSLPLSPISESQPRRVWIWLGVAWVVAFNFYFYSFTLPNNKSPRLQVWLQLPYELLMLPTEGGPPSGWQFLPQRFDLIGVAALIMLGSWGAGNLLLRLLPLPLPARCAERGVLAVGTGLSALSTLTLGLGLMGMLRRELFGGVIVASVFGEIVARFIARRNLASNQTSEMKSSLKWIVSIAVLPFLLAMALGAMLPSTDFDVKEYHLEGPKEFFQAGRIEMLEHNVYTSFPFHTEMLSLLAMVLRGDWFRGAMAGQAVLMCFAPLTAWAIFAAGRRWFSPAAGWLAALIYLSTPWTFRISTIAYTEGGLSFYLAAALLAVMLTIEQLKRDEPSRAMTLLAGTLAGSAMACKYPGVLSVVIPLGLVLVAAPFIVLTDSSKRFRTAFLSGAMFSAGVLITIGPWLAKNFVETGNPVYPLVYSVFGGKDWDADLNAKWKAAHSPKHHDLTEIPFWVADIAARNDWLSALLYALAPLALVLSRKPRVTLPLWLYVGWLFFTWWGFTHRLDRFWVPMLPVVALLAGIGAAALRGVVGRLIVGAGIVAALLFNLGMIVSGLSGYNHFLADLDAARDWTARLTSPEISYLNDELPQESKVLCVGEAEVFDATFPLVYNTVFDKSIFQEWTAVETPGVPAGELSFKSADEIRQKLRDEGITHVLVNWQEILRYRLTYGYTDYITLERFDTLQKRGILAPPLTFATRVLPDGLSGEEIAEAKKTWQPTFMETIDRRKAFVGGVRSGIGDRKETEEKTKESEQRTRDEIMRWSPAILSRTSAGPVLFDWQLYPVLP